MRIRNLIATETLSLSATPVDIATYFPDIVGDAEGLGLVFHGDATEVVYVCNSDASIYLPVPANEISEWATFSRDAFFTNGFKYLAAAGATDCTVTFVLVEG